jgi:DNA repair exonuclease SbcCD ATPase subunit
MRTVGLVLALAVCLGGCKGNNAADPPSDPAAVKAQQELLARRDALMAQRKKLESERDQLDAEIKQITEKGGDATEVIRKRDALVTQIETQGHDLTSLSDKIDQVVAQVGPAAGVAGREAGIATRERQVAERERTFADRERQIAQREAALAQRERETCGVAAPTIVQVPAPTKGSAYTRKDIEPLLKRARAAMQKKGLLENDLGPAGSLESEATGAMKANDWGKAYLAAAQLAATVDAIKIDRNFIATKAARLQAVIKRSQRDEATQRQLGDGLTDVMQKFGDGDFAAANRKLNQLWAIVR